MIQLAIAEFQVSVELMQENIKSQSPQEVLEIVTLTPSSGTIPFNQAKVTFVADTFRHYC